MCTGIANVFLNPEFDKMQELTKRQCFFFFQVTKVHGDAFQMNYCLLIVGPRHNYTSGSSQL